MALKNQALLKSSKLNNNSFPQNFFCSIFALDFFVKTKNMIFATITSNKGILIKELMLLGVYDNTYHVYEKTVAKIL